MSYEKDFKKWSIRKQGIDAMASRVFFQEKEVWWCNLGVNVGFEQDGKGENFLRPVLIFKKFNNELCWAIPLSTSIKTGRFYRGITFADEVQRVAIISQLRLLDAKRFVEFKGIVSDEEYLEIEKAVIRLCG